MTLPSPPLGHGRQLLQATWDFARRELRWPSFTELDWRLNRRHRIDVGQVLRDMPPGFLFGVGASSPIPPIESQEIGLTIAGVAACQNTGEVLSMFTEFIRLASSIEKTWQPPDDQPTALASLSDTEFASHASTLPPAGRDRLLRLLFLILQAEGMGYVHC